MQLQTNDNRLVTPEERSKALESAIGSLEKRFGKGTLMRLGEKEAEPVEVVSTGALSLDLALGVGGYPKGRVIEIFGPESSGKTTLTLHAIAEVQRNGGTCAFIDAEHALDVTYAKALDVDLDSLLIAQPDSGEQALEVLETLVRSGAVDLVVVDSVAALVPQAELEGNMGDAQMGLQARLMSQALRKITGVTARSGCMVIFINQLRQKIGVTFGNGETTTGGNALKFYATVRLDIRRIGAVGQDKENSTGNRVKIKVVKNKVAPPFRSVETEIIFGRGICRAGDLIELAEEAGLLDKNGAWYALGSEKFNGKEKLREKLMSDAEAFKKLETKVRSAAMAAQHEA